MVLSVRCSGCGEKCKAEVSERFAMIEVGLVGIAVLVLIVLVAPYHKEPDDDDI
jgi:hypothetical protein